MVFVLSMVKLGDIWRISWMCVLGCIDVNLILAVEKLHRYLGVNVGIFLWFWILVGYWWRYFICLSWGYLGEVGFGILWDGTLVLTTYRGRPWFSKVGINHYVVVDFSSSFTLRSDWWNNSVFNMSADFTSTYSYLYLSKRRCLMLAVGVYELNCGFPFWCNQLNMFLEYFTRLEIN